MVVVRGINLANENYNVEFWTFKFRFPQLHFLLKKNQHLMPDLELKDILVDQPQVSKHQTNNYP
jgi:hypothetical protein